MEIDNYYCFQQSGDAPDLEFVYDDADSHENEIAELYTYTEEAEFFQNKKAFEDTMKEYGFEPKWHTLSETARQDVALRLMDGVDVSPRAARMQAVRAVLYIMQGAFGECTTLEEQPHRARNNVFLLYRHGFFHVFLQLLNMEIDNSSAATSALRKPAVSLGDSTDLRAILSVLYIFVEVMRVSSETDTDDMKRDRTTFANELGFPRRNAASSHSQGAVPGGQSAASRARGHGGGGSHHAGLLAPDLSRRPHRGPAAAQDQPPLQAAEPGEAEQHG